MHRRALLAALASAVALAVPSAASAAPPLPFGHACTAQNGTLFCPTPDLASRVPGWDGTPLDVDVTLPATGDGPFPTIVLLHGWGQTKTSLESSSRDGNGGATYHYNNVYFAQLGFAVVNYSARGFGHSCGRSDPATPGCERGWSHLADQRYEIRDTQHLLGVLADEGIAKPDALGVSGISYGGGQSMQLALLRDHVRLPDGTLAPWRSPSGTPLAIAVAWPRWGWSDLGRALVPNGLAPRPGTIGQPLSPVGVPIQSYIDTLYGIRGLTAPPGADPTADLATWKAITDRGDRGPAATAVLRELQTYHSAAGLLGAPGLGAPAPTMLENGWTDDLFPPREALAFYDAVRRRYPQATVGLQLADLGHSRGSNKPDVDRALNLQGDTFLSYYLPSGAPVPLYALVVGVTAYRQTCPKLAPAGGAIRAGTYAALARGAVRLRGGAGRVTSSGGDVAVGRAVDPLNTGAEVGGNACATVRAARAPGTAAYEMRTRGFTLVGLPTLRVRVRARGSAPQLIARVWDVLPDGTQRLVTRGAYRLRSNQSGTIAFGLHGNAYRFAPGHRVLLELLARDAPYYRLPDTRFTIRVRSASLTLPTREGPRRSRGIGKPAVPRRR
jgi:hypothetical protein